MARYTLWRRQLFLGLALLLATIFAFNGRSWIEARSHTTTTPTIETAQHGTVARLLGSSAEGLQIELEVPHYAVDAAGTVVASGLKDVVQEAGAPALPYYSTLLVVPPEAQVAVTVQTTGIETQTGVNVRPAPQPVLDTHSSEALYGAMNTVYEQDPAIYAASETYPRSTYRISAPMYYRDLRLVRLDLFPLRYNPASQTLEHAKALQVAVAFSGAQLEQRRPAGGSSPATDAPIAPFILNYADAQEWRSLPAALQEETVRLPIGQDTFKIEVNEDGIYEITRQQLVAAGMDVGSVDPRTFEMMYRGETVAYQLVNDNGDEMFDEVEKIRFYGWAFDGPRTEKQFITNNVYWLWAGGDATLISEIESDTSAPLAESYVASVTREEDILYYDTLTTDWTIAPNEPDAWYWQLLVKGTGGTPVVHSNQVMLTAPASAVEGASARLTAELTNFERDFQRDQLVHDVDIFLNGNMSYLGNTTWVGIKNVNITTTVPISVVNDGANTIQLQFNVENTQAASRYYLNRITAEYDRRFVAENEQIIFQHDSTPHSYQVEGFSVGNPDNAIVWEISDRQLPIALTGVQVSGEGPYNYHFGTGAAGVSFIATHTANIKAPQAIEKYVPVALDPGDGGADWLAISYGPFIPTLNELAAHRANPTFGGLNTDIVDIEDVINQYGFGLPIPAAIQNYLAHALQSWSVAPRYVLLAGDATVDPRQICDTDDPRICPWGKSNEINYVPTDLLFNDRVRAHVVSDYTYALLAGDDLIPDVAVGRFAVQTAGELSNVIEKIIGYETQHLTRQPWHRHALFVADNTDNAGDFCAANQAVGEHLPGGWVQNHLCLPDESDSSITAIKQAFSDAVNQGTTFVNYRGHGSIQEWAHQIGGSTAEENPLENWFNYDKPVIILSMDCHDGNFSRPNMPSLAEGLLKLEHRGTVAHWSSTGLGWDYEHDILHRAFYDGVFEAGLTPIGDAVNYSKIVYEQTLYHESQLYAFTLQGDPAMLVARGLLTQDVYLPALYGD